jgi:hypothetical protein
VLLGGLGVEAFMATIFIDFPLSYSEESRKGLMER